MSVEVGNIVEGVVTGIAKFGAFVEVAEKKVGLVHISEVADEYVNDVNDYLKVGDKVNVKVLSVESNGKIGLSIKQTQPKKEEERQPADRSPRRERGNHNHRSSFPDWKEQERRAASNMSFEDKLSRFLKDSDERLSDLKRNTESKRGGRGARRSN